MFSNEIIGQAKQQDLVTAACCKHKLNKFLSWGSPASCQFCSPQSCEAHTTFHTCAQHCSSLIYCSVMHNACSQHNAFAHRTSGVHPPKWNVFWTFWQATAGWTPWLSCTSRACSHPCCHTCRANCSCIFCCRWAMGCCYPVPSLRTRGVLVLTALLPIRTRWHCTIAAKSYNLVYLHFAFGMSIIWADLLQLNP